MLILFLYLIIIIKQLPLICFSLGNFGAIFIPDICKVENAQLFAARPGLRLWKSSISGSVMNTYLFKDNLIQPHHQLKILPYQGQTHSVLKSSDQQFGSLLLYREKYIVSWSDTHLYVLNPCNTTVIGSQPRLGVILGVAVTDEEIFVLRRNTNKNIVRIALKPEKKHSKNVNNLFLKDMYCK